MSRKTQETSSAGRGVFSIRTLFLNILPVNVILFSLIGLLMLGAARIGLFGESLRGIVRDGSFFGNPLAIMFYIVAALSIAVAAITSVVIDRLSRHRRAIIDNGIEELRSGRLDRSSNAKLIAADQQFYEKLEEISNTIHDLEEQDKVYARDCSAAQADRDQLSFNLLSAKASPAMLRRVLGHLEQIGSEGRGKDMQRVSELLSDITASVLTDAHTLVPMSSELNLIRDYLDMEEMVTGDKIAFRMSIMCSIVDYKLLPNIILPIISNFVEYSRRGTRIGKYEISLELSVVRSHMLLILRDNGSGIEASELHRLCSRIDSDVVDMFESDISLPSINRRIKLYYGSDCGLKLSSSRLGTVVKLYMPVQTNDNF